MLRGLICFASLLVVADGSLVKVLLGGNTTVPCSIKDDKEIIWISTNGNHTFDIIMALQFTVGIEAKPEPSSIHPQYSGRIKAVGSSTNTHSLLLQNITEADLMLYCCMDFLHNETHCSKLERQDSGLRTLQDSSFPDEGTSDNKGENSYDITVISLTVITVLLFLSILLNGFMCGILSRNGNEMSQKKCQSTQRDQDNETEELSYASVNFIKSPKPIRQHLPPQEAIYAPLK